MSLLEPQDGAPVRAARTVPFDVAAAERTADWRRGLAWPGPHAQTRALNRMLCRRYLDFVAGLEDEDARAVVLLAGAKLVSAIAQLANAALWIGAERETGIRLLGGPPALAELRGEAPGKGQAFTAAAPLPPANLRGAWLRRIARTASWTAPWRLPAALIAPNAVAVSHNDLLCAFAADGGARVSFRHAPLLLDAARRRAGGTPGDAPPGDTPLSDAQDGLLVRFIDALTQIDGLDGEPLARLRALIVRQSRPAWHRAAADLSALAAYPGLPRDQWAGTGGYYPARALAVATLRRGGQVTRFAHTSANGIAIDDLEPMAMTELSVSTRFVLPTAAVCAHVAASGATALVRPYRSVTLLGHKGRPKYRAFAHLSRPQGRRRRRVVYATQALLGFRQSFPPNLPDVVYLDWQMRVAEMLKDLPLELICKPHPEGALRGRRHPLAAVAPTSTEPFEALIESSDLFIFDYPLTTPFFISLCTDRPVVFIDLGLTEFTAPVAAELARRCRIVHTTFDAANLPRVDPAELREAVLGGPDAADPGFFRRLLLGEGAAL